MGGRIKDPDISGDFWPDFFDQQSGHSATKVGVGRIGIRTGTGGASREASTESGHPLGRPKKFADS